MTLDLYINRSDNRTLNKSIVLVAEGVPCDFKLPTDEDNPDIMVASTLGDAFTTANYCRVRETGVYYEIANRTYERGGIVTLHCVMDDFYTFRTYIGNITALIERQEFIFDPYIRDNMVVLDSRRVMDNVIYGTIVEQGNHVIINTTGGGE